MPKPPAVPGLPPAVPGRPGRSGSCPKYPRTNPCSRRSSWTPAACLNLVARMARTASRGEERETRQTTMLSPTGHIALMTISLAEMGIAVEGVEGVMGRGLGGGIAEEMDSRPADEVEYADAMLGVMLRRMDEPELDEIAHSDERRDDRLSSRYELSTV